jgi:Flp pilus assembly protein CpaB
MGESLNPTLLERISRTVRPDFTRTARARRLAAGLLVVLAGVAALRPDARDVQREVAIAARDLSPGTPLTADDVRMENRSAATLPDGAHTDLAIIGSTLAGPARRGEVLTDARVLGPRLAGLSAGRDARVVPLHLADAAVLDLIRTGDVVDILGAPSADANARPRVIATNAVVVLVSATAKTIGSSNDRVVLVALPASAAHALAGATLVQTVTLTIH